MFAWFKKAPARRAEIRRNRPDHPARRWEAMRASGMPLSLAIAAGFCAVAVAILMLREDVVRYRPGQVPPHDIVSRVDFAFTDKAQLAAAQRLARERAYRVYRADEQMWDDVEKQLLALPDHVQTAASLDELPPDLKQVLDSGSFTRLKDLAAGQPRQNYERVIRDYIAAVRQVEPGRPQTGLYILPPGGREIDARKAAVTLRSGDGATAEHVAADQVARLAPDDLARVVEPRLSRAAKANVELALQNKVVLFTLARLRPTHLLDEAATAEAANRAEADVPRSAGEIAFGKNQVLVKGRDTIDDRGWLLLRAENEAFQRALDEDAWKSRAGVAATAVIVTLVLAAYVAMFQPKVVRNHARAIAIAALLLSMLLVAQLAGIASSPVYVFAIAPSIIVAMILAIAYDQRFAAGVTMLHAVLVTIAVGEGLSFFLIVLSGALTCCFLLDEVRTRSKLIEVGGATAVAMMAATAAAGLLALDPLAYVGRTSLFTGAAGLTAGFLVLGILPVIEKWFRITTSVRLLELADASHPLLRRLAIEAPGTYNHSLQVATIAEAAAESIGANSLLCRVASYYHDVGKINKADYFVENQFGGENRHINLSPSVSLLIIIGHVKDGVELAKEYDLPTSIFPFIQQHHGTTLVEYFYHRACNQQQQQQQLCTPGTPDAPSISETQYRYPGPKPRSKEAAIVMLADAVESACRTLNEPNAPRIEQLVHDLLMKRLLDGQFEECDVTMRELEQVEKACVRILLGVYHGRIAYPSAAALAAAAGGASGGGGHRSSTGAAAPVARTA